VTVVPKVLNSVVVDCVVVLPAGVVAMVVVTSLKQAKISSVSISISTSSSGVPGMIINTLVTIVNLAVTLPGISDSSKTCQKIEQNR